MVQTGNLDAAEQATTRCSHAWPMSMTATTALGMIREASDDQRQTTDYCGKAVNVISQHPDAYDPGFEAVFRKRIDRLEPKASAAADRSGRSNLRTTLPRNWLFENASSVAFRNRCFGEARRIGNRWIVL